MPDTLVKLFATFVYLGRWPYGGGTLASLAALVLAWIFRPWAEVIAAFSVVACAAACAPARRIFGERDPRAFVLDEVCGQLVAVAGFEPRAGAWVAAFVVFRIFDIAKPWPIGSIERRPEASSILWDDLAAGAAANLIVRMFLAVGVL